MADETTSTLANLLYDMREQLVENFSKRKKLITELERNTGRENFDGLQVRVPQLLTLKQGTHGLAETGTVLAAKTLDDAKALIPMARVAHAIGLSPDLIKSSEEGNFAKAGGALKLHMEQAEVALPCVENEMVNGDGLGILDVASASTNTTAITVAAADANWYQLYPGRVVDIVTVATGVAIANGSSRTILSVNKTTGVVTLDAGGGAVNVTSGTHGIGIEGTSGNAIQGVGQAAGAGLFEGIDGATVVQWRGVDGRAGDTTAADLSIPILDGMEREVIPSGKEIDFYLADRAVHDKYGQTILTVSRWGGAEGELETGWKGIKYRDKVVVPEDDAKAQRVLGICKKALTLYAYDNGPDWDDFDGMFKRFSRTLPVEAWLVDYVQLGVHQRNCFVYADNLNRAA